MPTLEQIITEAQRLARDDKALAYHYLMGILTGGADGKRGTPDPR